MYPPAAQSCMWQSMFQVFPSLRWHTRLPPPHVASQASHKQVTTGSTVVAPHARPEEGENNIIMSTIFPRIQPRSQSKPGLKLNLVNLPIQIEKQVFFQVSISTLSWFEPGWLWTMKLIKPQDLNRGFTVTKSLKVAVCMTYHCSAVLYAFCINLQQSFII